MSNTHKLRAAQTLMRCYAGLARRQICTRAVHHVFKLDEETGEVDADGEVLLPPSVGGYLGYKIDSHQLVSDLIHAAC